MNREELMREAIDLALRGRGEVEPNPRVGALALEGDRVVGRGWHEQYGDRHAEVVALEDAARQGKKPDCLISTLEPCSSAQGVAGKKTSACTQRLVSEGIRRLIYGAEDPDPRHAGKAGQELGEAGLSVESGVLADECQAINRPFLRWLGLDRPWTIAKYAMSLDGKIATRSGESRWISGAESRKRAHALRARVDAVVVGYRTADMDDPELNLRLVEGAQPIRLWVDPLLALDSGKKLIAQAGEIPSWVLHRDDVRAENRDRVAAAGVLPISVPATGARGLDLAAAWRELRQRGLKRVLVEGGGSLLDQLCRADCLDQVRAFLAPRIIGSQEAPGPFAGVGFEQLDAAPGLAELHWQASAEDLMLGAFFLDPA